MNERIECERGEMMKGGDEDEEKERERKRNQRTLTRMRHSIRSR